MLASPQAHPIPYYGLPGLGLNAGVALMNLTRCFPSDEPKMSSEGALGCFTNYLIHDLVSRNTSLEEGL